MSFHHWYWHQANIYFLTQQRESMKSQIQSLTEFIAACSSVSHYYCVIFVNEVIYCFQFFCVNIFIFEVNFWGLYVCTEWVEMSLRYSQSYLSIWNMGGSHFYIHLVVIIIMLLLLICLFQLILFECGDDGHTFLHVFVYV